MVVHLCEMGVQMIRVFLNIHTPGKVLFVHVIASTPHPECNPISSSMYIYYLIILNINSLQKGRVGGSRDNMYK